MSFIDEWVIYMLGGLFVIGRPDAERTKLDPCYQLVRAPSATGVNIAVIPLCFLHEWTEIPYPQNVPSFPVSGLSRQEKAATKAAVEKCSGVIEKMKAEASGITLASKLDIRGL